MTRAVFIGLLLSSLLAFYTGAARAEFKDPLITPAMPTQRLTEAPMTAVTRASTGRLVAVGWRGVIIASDDNGNTWQQASVPVREDLAGVTFPLPEHGFAVGHDGVVLESHDGGKSWAKTFDGNLAATLMVQKYERMTQVGSSEPRVASALAESKNFAAIAPGRPFLDVWFENANVGYVIGNFNLIFRTADAGKTWEPLYERTDNPSGYNLYAMRSSGNELFIVGELGIVLRYDRDNDRFVAVPTPYPGSYFSIVSTAGLLIATGLRGNAFRSTDAGKTWQKIDFGIPTPATFAGGVALEDGRIVLVTLDGELLSSADGGQHFSRLKTRAPMPYSGVAAAGKNTVVVVGPQGTRVETIQ